MKCCCKFNSRPELAQASSMLIERKPYKKLVLNEYPSSQDPSNNSNSDLISTRSDQESIKRMPPNVMRFQKYTILTFLPVFLFSFFSKFTNMYFLIMTIMFMIPAISPYTSAAGVFPLAFITIVACIREIIEDFGRYTSDKSANQSIFLRILNGAIEKKYWRDLVCGDLI
jgi:magnesium-transporting ATPase (P-type)